jgi:hypothetical protein
MSMITNIKFLLKLFSIGLLLFISFSFIPDTNFTTKINQRNLVNKYEDMLVYKNQSGHLELIDNQYYVHIDSGIDSEYLPTTLTNEQIYFFSNNKNVTAKILSISKDNDSDIGTSSSCFVDLTLCERDYISYELVLFMFILISAIWLTLS